MKQEDVPTILDYVTPLRAIVSTERTLYLMMRIGIAAIGLILVVGTLSSEFVTPDLLYDEAPGPPPLRERVPGIFARIGIGLLLCVPHRWTTRGFLFWPRFGIYVLLTGFLLFRSFQFWMQAFDGGKLWGVNPISLLLACVGLSFPLCLLWSRRIRRAVECC